MLTDYELRGSRRLPMTARLTLDIALGALLAAPPWLLGFFVGAGLLTMTSPSDRAAG